MRTVDFRQIQFVDCREVHFNACGDFLSRGRTNEDERAHFCLLHDTPPRRNRNPNWARDSRLEWCNATLRSYIKKRPQEGSPEAVIAKPREDCGTGLARGRKRRR